MLTISKSSRKIPCNIYFSRRLFSLSTFQGNNNAADEEDWDQEWMEQDKRAAEYRPQPWENLLRWPAQTRVQPPPTLHLIETQKRVLEAGGRTNRQLWRTFDRIIQSHSALAEKREEERRKTTRGAKRKADEPSKTKEVQPVFYGPEQTLAGLKNRLLPNYTVARRVLAEASSIIGPSFQPRRILDCGIGCGAASAAVIDLFPKVEWIHGIDPSKSQREVAEAILNAPKSATDESITRITVSESLSASNNGKGGKGTFDLALCCYTLNEMLHTASALTLAAMQWEKLANGGVLVIIEPGTPDGFNTIRSIREMLLDCCPIIEDDEDGHDQCHIIAPCTHNGSCPMERHKKIESTETLAKNQFIYSTPVVKSSSQSEKGELEVYESNWNSVDDDDDGEWLDPDTFDPEGHPDWTEESWDTSPSQNRGGVKSLEEEHSSYLPKYMSKLTAFDAAFCSFIQPIHGGERRSEKFSYLVAQKIISGSGVKEYADELNLFSNVNLADLIASSIQKFDDNLLKRAMDIEERFLASSDANELGLELVQGKNLSSWGRLVRPPIKKKGHVILDFCSGKQMGQGDGQIIRHRVSKSVMSRVAPGAYTAARKARWGGLWPDISYRFSDDDSAGSNAAKVDS